MTVTMGMEMAMASGRFLQFTQTNSRGGRGEPSCGGGDCLRGQGQADLVSEERMSLDGVCHLICLGTCGGGL